MYRYYVTGYLMSRRVKIKIPVGVSASDRQEAWRAESIERLQATRARRLKRLAERDVSVQRALRAYNGLEDPTVPTRIRTEFVARRKSRLPQSDQAGEHGASSTIRDRRIEARGARPPLTKLLMKPTQALPSYLSMLYVVSAETSAGQSRITRQNVTKSAAGHESWAVLCGRWASTIRARRARLNRDLDELASVDLVEVGPQGMQGRYEGFTLLADDGRGHRYRLPKSDATWPAVLDLPAPFFRNGWHLVLTPAEIAVLLMAMHASRAIPVSSSQRGVAVPQSVRSFIYGVSGEAYSAIHELEEFGILEVVDPMPHRHRGKLRLQAQDERAAQEAEGASFNPVPYQLIVKGPDAFDRSALQCVRRCLAGNPSPPRRN